LRCNRPRPLQSEQFVKFLALARQHDMGRLEICAPHLTPTRASIFAS
jgi:hypothetical protein